MAYRTDGRLPPTSAITFSKRAVPNGTVKVSTRSNDSTDCGYVAWRKELCGDDNAKMKTRGSCGT